MSTDNLDGRHAELRAQLDRYLDNLDAALERGDPALAGAFAQAAQAVAAALALAGDDEPRGDVWTADQPAPRYRNMSAEDGEPS